MFVIKFNDLSDALFYFNRLNEDAENDYKKYNIKKQYKLIKITEEVITEFGTK